MVKGTGADVGIHMDTAETVLDHVWMAYCTAVVTVNERGQTESSLRIVQGVVVESKGHEI